MCAFDLAPGDAASVEVAQALACGCRAAPPKIVALIAAEGGA